VKFLLDVCASSQSLRTLLADLGHDVRLAVDVDPRASDETLLDLAFQEKRVLVTEDKDFGELVFVHRLPHPSIIRFVEMRVEDQVAAMQELLNYYSAELEGGTLIVVTRGRVRIRH
jgi:predicted nuclease of predicted toxin-antitoxin system